MMMMPQRSILLLLLFLISIHAQQLQWIMLTDGSSLDTPQPRRDAALGFDSTFLILFGGRSQNGMPLPDSYAFNLLQGQWDPLNFPNPPSSRYGMASTSSMSSGLYIFGGFGQQGSSQNYNPYMAYGSGQQPINYNYATPPNFMQNPILMNNPNFVNNPNYNPMSGTNFNYNNMNDDDRSDQNFYPLQDGWFLNYATKSWQQTQTSQYARAFGSAAVSPFGAYSGQYMAGTPQVVYSMGKGRDWMYSVVESVGQGTSGLSQTGAMQSTILMYDLPSLSPAYPHARYGHVTSFLTDNQLLLYGGCLSGYGKGGPCPSKDTWLLTMNNGRWERLSECPTTKYGPAMVTLPSISMCASMGTGIFGPTPGINQGQDQPVAVLWGGREFNPSSINAYTSPRDEVAVFSLSQKQWYLKRARPFTDGSYPMQREGAAYVAGCFQGAPGMFVYGGRSVADRRYLNDLWFLQGSSQDALNSPGTRGCTYPFSYYHLHGIFQFFTYGVIFPIGYLVGRHAGNLRIKRPLHMILQIFGVMLAVCGFAFGVHSVRAPSWLHFKHAHAIIGIITFILTIFQFILGLVGAIFVKRAPNNSERLTDGTLKGSDREFQHDTWAGEGSWRLGHRILGSIVLALGLVNISLGVFLAVLPLPVWIIWYIYLGILVLILVGLEILALLRRRGAGGQRGVHKLPAKREDPKGTSQSSLKYSEEPTQQQQQPAAVPLPRRGMGRVPPPEPSTRDSSLHRRGGDDMAPLLPTQSQQRQPRPGDVSAAPSVPEYHRPTDREYPVPSRKKSGPSESAGFDYYVGYAPEHEQPLPRTTQQQSEHNLTRVRLQ